MRIYLIRHGETEYNHQRLMQGHSEVPLNDTGIAQVTCLANRLRDESIEHIYSSDLRRAVMTGCIIGSHTGAPITYDAVWRERNPGALTEKTYDEGAAFFDDPDYEPPGGESVSVFEARVRAATAKLIEQEDGRGRRVAIATHGMVCLAFLRQVFPDVVASMGTLASRNGSVTIAEYDGQWRPVAILDTSHLDGLDTA